MHRRHPSHRAPRTRARGSVRLWESDCLPDTDGMDSERFKLNEAEK